MQLLSSGDFLGRLDSAQDYRSGNRLRVSRVLEAVSDNSAPAARRVMVQLTLNKTFLADISRVTELLRFSVNQRPPPPEVLAFWDKYCQPDDGFTPITVTVLVENGSPAALALFEKKMGDSGHSDGAKIAWMHSRILPHRNDAALLESCQRLLLGGLPERLRGELVESLFDYKPEKWLLPASVSTPPDRLLATEAARAELRKIGEWSLEHVALDEVEKAVVKGVLQGLKT